MGTNQTVTVSAVISPAGQPDQAVADDLRTALLGLKMDTPYDVLDVTLADDDERDEATIAKAHAELSADLAAEDAAWDARIAEDRRGMPEGVANPVQTGEDFPGGDVDTDDLAIFAKRLLGWLNDQPEIAGSAEVVMDNGPDDRGQVSDIILGLSFGQTPVSMTMNVTP